MKENKDYVVCIFHEFAFLENVTFFGNIALKKGGRLINCKFEKPQQE